MDNRNGFSIPEGADAAAALKNIFDHPELFFDRMSRAGIELAEEKFSEEMFIKKFNDLREVLK